MSNDEWVRMHDTPGRVLARYTGDHEGRNDVELAVVQTVSGIQIWPARSLLPANMADAERDAARQMIPIIEALEATGMTEQQMESSFRQAMAAHRRIKDREAKLRGVS